MSNNFGSFCDDFYADMYVNTELDLPKDRDTILAFFERIQKQFPTMNCFNRCRNNEYSLEEDKSSGQYRWVMLELDRIGSGMVNPINIKDVHEQNRLVLELAPYMLSVNHLDINSLDITFGMDFDCRDNHDEVIAEALFGNTAFNCLINSQESKIIGFSPAITISLSEDNHTQARLCIESRTSIYEPSKGKQDRDEPICLSLTIRRYSGGLGKFDAIRSFENQCRLAEELMTEKIIPEFVRPLINTIAQKRLI
jgi:hypothetical protein